MILTPTESRTGATTNKKIDVPALQGQSRPSWAELQKMKRANLVELQKEYGITLPGRPKNGQIASAISDFLDIRPTIEPMLIESSPVRRAHKGRRDNNKTPKKISTIEERLQQLTSPITIRGEARPKTLATAEKSLYQWALRVAEKGKSNRKLPSSSIFSPLISFPAHMPNAAASCTIATSNDSYPNASRQLQTTTAPIETVSRKPSTVEKTYNITLGSGKRLEYTEADFLEPPSLNGLVSAPEELYSIWDDTTPEWSGQSPLTIRLTVIAVKYWEEFYRNFTDRGSWYSFKQNWYTYRLLMSEYGSMEKEKFIMKWKDETKMKASHKIVASLRETRRAEEEELMKLAQVKYPGEKFAAAFSYRKNGQTRMLEDPRAIAKRYLRYEELQVHME